MLEEKLEIQTQLVVQLEVSNLSFYLLYWSELTVLENNFNIYSLLLLFHLLLKWQMGS